jgi:hypothetical protein
MGEGVTAAVGGLEAEVTAAVEGLEAVGWVEAAEVEATAAAAKRGKRVEILDQIHSW